MAKAIGGRRRDSQISSRRHALAETRISFGPARRPVSKKISPKTGAPAAVRSDGSVLEIRNFSQKKNEVTGKVFWNEAEEKLARLSVWLG